MCTLRTALVASVASTAIAFQPLSRFAVSRSRRAENTIINPLLAEPIPTNSEDDLAPIDGVENFESASTWDVADDWEAAAGASWEDDEVIKPSRIQQESSETTTRRQSKSVQDTASDEVGRTSSSGGGWSVTDDWEANWAVENRPMDSQDVFHQDPLTRMAFAMEFAEQQPEGDATPEDEWIHDAVDKIMLPEDLSNVLDSRGAGQSQQDDSNSSFSGNESIDDGLRVEKFIDEMGTEIAMLVRCNESPEEMLIEQGRAVAQLSEAERYDVTQLVTFNPEVEEWQPTLFLRDAVHAIFREHATLQLADKSETKWKSEEMEAPLMSKVTSDETVWVMNERGVSSWTEKSTQETCGRFDPRVRTVISKYGVYGKGYLMESDLLRLYMETLVGPDLKRASQLAVSCRTAERSSVWRDLKNHGFLPPAEEKRTRRLEEIQMEHGLGSSVSNQHQAFMDECEIIDDSLESWSEDAHGRWHRKGKSSHEQVELVSTVDGKVENGGETTSLVPLRMRDGDFVYIDEESCIGCTQCALASPASFRMLENGRARTFKQRVAPDVGMAVAACPVNCMHYVGFERLKELELARDSPEGDGRKDHRHFGRNQQSGGWHTHIPLHVARRDSSDNKKDSLYHFLRRKCYKSHACPQRGCYDCPMYASNPEKNPHLQKRRREAAHVRAQHFIANGEADAYRKEIEL